MRARRRFSAKPHSRQAGPVPCHVASPGIGQGAGLWPPQAQGAHCASPLSGNSRKPGLGGTVSFPLSEDLSRSIATGLWYQVAPGAAQGPTWGTWPCAVLLL